MPLQLPNLDDRTYEDLVAEALSLIPTYDPDWTNHNPSDPGITLIELFAYLTEILIYRLNRVTNANKYTFLKLIDPTLNLSPQQIQNETILNNEIQKVILALRQENRTITSQDFERLALAADSNVARAHCIPRRNLVSGSEAAATEDKPGHISLVIVPKFFRATARDIDIVPIMLLKDGDTIINDYEIATQDNNQTALFLNQNSNQFLYIGLDIFFVAIEFVFNIVGKNYDLKFEYFDGENWTELLKNQDNLNDKTDNWSGNGVIKFTANNQWQRTEITEINSPGLKYWIRISTKSIPTQVASILKILPKTLNTIIQENLEPKRLLTTILHIVEAKYLSLGVRLTVFLKPDIPQDKFLFGLNLEFLSNFNNTTLSPELQNKFQEQNINLASDAIINIFITDKTWVITDSQNRKKYIVRKERATQGNTDQLNIYEDIIRSQIIDTLQKFLHPLTGGKEQKGWPLGRSVYVSEIYELLDQLPAIDYVTKTDNADELIVGQSDRLIRNQSEQVIGVKLQPDELVDAPFGLMDIKISSSI